MAATRPIQNNFTSGILSPLTRGRTDINQYFNGLESCNEFVLLPQGGIKKRGGTQFIELCQGQLSYDRTTPTCPNGGTPANGVDQDDSTYILTTNNISTTNPYSVAELDLTSATTVKYMNLRAFSMTSSGSTTEFKIQRSDDGVLWTNDTDVPEVVATPEQDYRIECSGASARYWRLARVGSTDLGTNRVLLGEISTMTETSPTSNVKLEEFSVESDTHYLMVFTEFNCRIYKKDGLAPLANIETPYTSDQVSGIRTVQAESVMLVFQEDHPPFRIINGGSDTDWTSDDAPIVNVPQFDYNDSSSPTPVSDVQVITFSGFVAGDTYQMDVEGILSKNITYAGDSTADEQVSTANNLQKNLQEMPNFGDDGVVVARTGAAQYTVTCSGASADSFDLFSGYATSGTSTKTITVTQTTKGTPRSEDIWSATRGYPRSACFYDGRLWLGGTKSKKQSLFASKAGSFYDFDTGEGDADEAIFVTISSRKLNRIIDVYPGRDLQIFTTGSEFVVSNKPVTPENITVDPQTSHGSLNLEAKEVDGATFFIDRFGKKLLNYLYSFNEDAYATTTPSVLSPESIDTPVDMDILRGTSSSDANWVFLVNTDGTISVLNTLREQDVNGFTKFTPSGTSAAYKNVVVVDDRLYLIVNQTINGAAGNYLVKLDFDYQLDNSIVIAHGGGATLTGATHLANETVSVYADGNYLGTFTADSSGDITLGSSQQGYTNYEVGYLFTPSFKPLPISSSIGSGDNFLRIKKVVRANIRVYQNSLLALDGENLPSRQFNDSVDSPFGSLQAFTGIYEDVYMTQGWTRDEMPTFSLPEAGRGTILAIDFEVESA